MALNAGALIFQCDTCIATMLHTRDMYCDFAKIIAKITADRRISFRRSYFALTLLQGCASFLH